MKTSSLGVIGGMGPRATSVFFEKIIQRTDANTDQDHINMLILNHATLPDRTDVILNVKEDQFINSVAEDLALLQQAGVSNIAIPCNTAHYFYHEMQKMTTVPIINMVKETLKVAASRYGPGARIGILATTGTLNSGIYQKDSGDLRLELVKPNNELQTKIMDVIYNEIKKKNDSDPTEIEHIIELLLNEFGCQCVIIACTELSCIPLHQNIKKYCIDAMDILVEQSILCSGKKLKQQEEYKLWS
ncbi:aspartate/glutamate racemase family protein [Paenibacillus sp. VMFN-D1]|uniref:aspartate/glutamate racemase family protein n=1 Tax=Paenibacillus sp. VMFN-D1 TaxID=2135608 RepID=UPI000E2484D5|nr:amino acid racemase [Paenibacillus sp. VMFN-D1]RED37383.1 aspartate racemase [Paenibacillus sp. VMFN-D1]